MADEFSEDENEDDPGTPGIQEIDDDVKPDFNKFEADTETVEMERQLELEEARERQEDDQDNIIEHAVLKTHEENENVDTSAEGDDNANAKSPPLDRNDSMDLS